MLRVMATAGTTSPSAPLTDVPGFLLAQLGYHAAQRFAERLRPVGLQPKHYGLLAHLSVADGQSQQELADAMGIHRNVMVGLVDELEGRGLVERRRHPNDRRAHAVHLTAAAHALLPRAQQAVVELNAGLLAGLDEPEQRQLLSLLQRIAQHAGLSPGVHPSLRSP